MPLKGYKQTKEHKQRLSIIRKGRKLSEEHKRKIGEAGKGHIAWDKGLIKEKAPNWKGGISSIQQRIRASSEYVYWRMRCFIRDDFTCQKCGIKGGYLEVHHIKPFKQLLVEVKEYLPLYDLYNGAMSYTPLWDIHNGITLCKKCHFKERHKK